MRQIIWKDVNMQSGKYSRFVISFVFGCLISFIIGCGSSSSSPAPSPLNPAGIYNLTYTERSGGTCGPQTAHNVTITYVTPNYTWTEKNVAVNAGSMSCDSNHCTSTDSLSANLLDTSTGNTDTAALAYSVDITSTGMTGVLTDNETVTNSSGATISTCNSTYDVHGTKL